ncbi:nitrate regulatory gene2 protein-like [Olea europaea var. sylvestris]|uniref:nitrate regulatory gene2 protein-like n=1 Tax=Olea europaea var. sylvestris TaxID=158386 RepID=UPI000C1CF9EB|nr:nitrate regulatory gene2 protein-like [Olea europaea var. sylvestris]XP_022898964.1 nitrate regulatory gene2 protein-like [Olea europaea var. sylvestris]XP_022898966.1 nitrate regulatory gene2 protein-like [Olea europaea var. sylvestris]XP_022898967.1 nitrate regulatory gene2 protein-like [Olea europaea var. sylvestris]
MGASNSRLEEDKGLQLCRERKKLIKQALNGRCSLAAAHIAYIEELKIIGTALRKFVDPDSQVESSIDIPTSATPEPHAFIERSASQFSLSSQSLSQHVDTTVKISPSPSPPITSQNQAHHMKFRGTFSKKVEEKISLPVTVSVASTTPCSTEGPEALSFESPSIPSETPPWDYFGLFHPIDNQYSSQEGRGFHQDSEYFGEIKELREEEGVPELENVEEKVSSTGMVESHESEDEFDEPSTETLVRSFENVNRETENVVNNDALTMPLDTAVSETNFGGEQLNGEKENVTNIDSPIKSKQSAVSETKFSNVKKNNSPDLSPLRATSSRFEHLNFVKITPMKELEAEDTAAPKDFFSSMKDIEHLFDKASKSGKEVPRMLEANKFHFRPIFPGKERGSMTSALLKSCFSCGDDPSEVKEEPSQTSGKYLTWHRTLSPRSGSSRNLLGGNSVDDGEDVTNNLFDNFCMVSGSHASTLDRLYVWEKKLYDEVKASQVLRSNFDQKCKVLRQKESQGMKTDKTRAVVKDLHSRIRVAIHRIDSISKKIEEIRDTELQPQLEELIDGLRRMWDMMLECHELQFHIISVSHAPRSTEFAVQSDSRKQIAIYLENELNSLMLRFTKWISAQKIYVESIDKWLLKCVSLPQNKSKRNKRIRPPPIRNCGPPIYIMCGTWLERIDKLPSQEIVESIKHLTAEVAHFLPRQEKNQTKGGNDSHLSTFQAGTNDDTSGINMLKDEASEDWISGSDRFRTSLARFLGKFNNFSESSVKMFSDLQKVIEEAKENYKQFKSQS